MIHLLSILPFVFSTAAAPVKAQTIPVRIGYIPVRGTAQIFIADHEEWLEAGMEARKSIAGK